MDRRAFLTSGIMFGGFVALSGLSCASAAAVNENLVANLAADGDKDGVPFEKVVKTDAEWKRILTKEQYRVARQAGTDRANASKFY